MAVKCLNRYGLWLGFGIVITLGSCGNKSSQEPTESPSTVVIIGQMRDVMWRGELDSKIYLDTIKNKTGLYGLGPESGLAGELLIVDGKSFVSTVVDDTGMRVTESFQVGAPFFVYANAGSWKEIILPDEVQNLKQLERWMKTISSLKHKPFLFKLAGNVRSAVIHVQNLPPGSEVHSPTEAHKGQVNFRIENEKVDVVGFYSNRHYGIFTHHDTNMHLHLITKDRAKMGHLDSLQFNSNAVRLFISTQFAD